MAQGWFLRGLTEVQKQNINWTSATIKVMACNAFTVNATTQATLADISSNEITPITGYTAGGATLASKAINQNNTNLRVEYQAGNVTWTIPGTMSAQIFIVYLSTGTPSTSYLLGYDDKGSVQTRTADDFVLEFPNSNVLTVTLG